MPHDHTEDQLVEQPAIGLFADRGWTTVSALEETSGAPSPGVGEMTNADFRWSS
jgi:type I restriction enzyme R subunit